MRWAVGTWKMVINHVILRNSRPVIVLGLLVFIIVSMIIVIIMVMTMLVMVFIIVVIMLIIVVMTMVFMLVIVLMQQHPVPVCRLYVTRPLSLGCWKLRTDVIHNCGLELVQPSARAEQQHKDGCLGTEAQVQCPLHITPKGARGTAIGEEAGPPGRRVASAATGKQASSPRPCLSCNIIRAQALNIAVCALNRLVTFLGSHDRAFR